MSETEKFLEESGGDFKPAAEQAHKAIVDSLNTMCGGKLFLGEPSVAATSKDSWPEKLAGPLITAVYEVTGDIAGNITLVVRATDARAMCALMLGQEPAQEAQESAELNEDEADAFNELINTAGSSAGSALRAALSCEASVSPQPPGPAEGPEKVLEAAGAEGIFVFAGGALAEKETALLFVFSADLSRAIAATAAPPAEEPPPPPAEEAEAVPENVARILKIPVPLIVVLAEMEISFKDSLNLKEGSVIEFEKSSEEPLDLLVNNRKVGQGKVIKVGEHFGLRVDEIGSTQQIVENL